MINKKYITKTIISCLLIALVGSGCSKQLDINPRQSINASTALNSREAIEASITSVYVRLKFARMYGRDLTIFPDVLADNGFQTNKRGGFIGIAQNNQGAHFDGDVWRRSYEAINQINNSLEAIATANLNPAITETERNRWNAQLHFLRGLFYFNLANVYGYIPGAVVASQDRGSVPLITTGIATAEAAQALQPERASATEVYAQVVADLLKANTEFNGITLGINYANKAATQALLARVYLFSKNYTEAKRWADSTIELAGSRMTTTANYVSNWRSANHNETLFQVVFASSAENIGVNESLQTSLTTLGTPGNTAVTVGFGDLVPTLTLLNDLGITLTGGNTTTNFTANANIASRTGDVRNLLYEVGTTGRGPAKVECTKYLGKNGITNLDNIPVLRISEMYLIRAEAQAIVGSPVFDLSKAKDDLKFFKARRYLGYAGSALESADDALTVTSIITEILKQRRIEFAFEGSRFFDLKRFGFDLIKSPHYNNVLFTDTRILPALPQAEVDGNPKLKQNAGY